MTEQYKTVYEGGEGELVEKKSRFIATVRPVKTEEEANQFVEEMRKKYWDARHNCWAFILGERQEFKRCSDDGEPSQTAGKPMMDVLTGAGLTDVAVVVTRYFGGTLLGTGGLVRAYSRSVQVGLAASKIIEKTEGTLLSIRTDYNGIGKIQYLLGQRGLTITDSQYTDIVELETLVPQEQLTELKEAITEGTNGRAAFTKEEAVCFTFVDGEPLIF